MVLRPGGLIALMEFDFHAYDEHYQRIELETSKIAGPWWPRWLAFANLAARNRGGDVDAATHIHSWIANHRAFEDVVYREFWVPACHWRTDSDFEMRMGASMRDDILVSTLLDVLCNPVSDWFQAFLKSGRPLLLGSGVPEDLVNEMESNAHNELLSGKGRFYIRLQCVHGRKRHL